MSTLSAITSNHTNARNKAAALAEHCIAQMVPLMVGKDPADASIMFYLNDAETVNAVRYPGMWAASLQSQLTGYNAWKSSWRQSAGGAAITRRHLLNCAHWTDSFEGVMVRFVGTPGQYFETTVQKQYPISGMMTYGGATKDLEVWLLADELPSWVNVFPILTLSAAMEASLHTNSWSNTYPVVPVCCISQGYNNGCSYPMKLHVAGCWSYNYPNTVTGTGYFNRTNPHPTINPYYYNVFTGDSGTPCFLLVNGVFYLVGVMVGGGFSFETFWNAAGVAHINELIARVDAAQGISTGLTVTSTPLSL